MNCLFKGDIGINKPLALCYGQYIPWGVFILSMLDWYPHTVVCGSYLYSFGQRQLLRSECDLILLKRSETRQDTQAENTAALWKILPKL